MILLKWSSYRARMKGITFSLVSLSLFALTACKTAEQERKENYVFVYQKMGAEYLSQGKYAKALKQLKKIEKMDPENSRTLNLIGLSYMALEKIAPASRYFVKALKFDPDFSSARLNLSSCYIEVKKYSKAIKLLKKIKIREVEFPERVYHNRGLSYYHLGNSKMAKRFFNKAINENPTFYPSYLLLGQIANEKRKYTKAISWLKKAKRFCSVCAQPLYFLSVAYKNIGNNKKSRRYLKRVFELNPDKVLQRKAVALRRKLSRRR